MTEPRRRHMMVRLAWIFYLPMIATAVFVKAPGALRVEDWAALLQGAGTAVALGIGVVLLSRYLARNTEWGRALHVEFAAILVGLGSAEILALSLLSAFGEEILFRGCFMPGWDCGPRPCCSARPIFRSGAVWCPGPCSPRLWGWCWA